MIKGREIKKSKIFGKLPAVAVALILIFMFAVGGTIAYLVTSTSSVNNQFNPVYVTCEINNDGTIKNTGNIPAYIRAAVIVTWRDSNGTIFAKSPVVGTDYEIVAGTGWTKSGDYYYFNTAVAPSADTTTGLSVTSKGTATPADGFTLKYEIVASAIQSDPKSAVTEAWGYTPSN